MLKIMEYHKDEKYYLSDKMINFFENNTIKNQEKGNGFKFKPIEKENANISKCITTLSGNRMDDNFIIIKGKECPITKENDNFIEWKQQGLLDSDCRAWKDNKVSGTLTCKGNNKILETENLKTKNKRIIETAKKLDINIDGQYMDIFNQTNKQDISGTLSAGMDYQQGNIIYNNLRIRKLTPKECFRLMGVKDCDFNKIAENQSNASLYHLAGDSIVINVLMAIFKEMLCT